jgi:diphthamide synthase (EF-2-diphthine--ammonia ligase)
LLPEGVDPCGENGEFHTFVYDDPIFSRRIDFELGERVKGREVLIRRPYPYFLTRLVWQCGRDT